MPLLFFQKETVSTGCKCSKGSGVPLRQEAPPWQFVFQHVAHIIKFKRLPHRTTENRQTSRSEALPESKSKQQNSQHHMLKWLREGTWSVPFAVLLKNSMLFHAHNITYFSNCAAWFGELVLLLIGTTWLTSIRSFQAWKAKFFNLPRQSLCIA